MRVRVWAGGLLPGEAVPALPLLQPLPLPQGDVVALVDPPDLLAVGAEHLRQGGEDHILAQLHPVGHGLGHQDVVEPVHRQAGELVGLPKDDPAAVQVLGPHHRPAVGPGVLQAAAPERLVKAVVSAAAEEPDADLAVEAEQAGAQIAPPAADHVHQGAVLRRYLRLADDLLPVDPGVAGGQAALGLGGDGIDGIGAGLFHKRLPLYFWMDSMSNIIARQAGTCYNLNTDGRRENPAPDSSFCIGGGTDGD